MSAGAVKNGGDGPVGTGRPSKKQPHAASHSLINSTTNFGTISQSIHAPYHRVLDLIIVQIFQQLGIEKFHSFLVVKVLGEALVERLQMWSYHLRQLIDFLGVVPQAGDDPNTDQKPATDSEPFADSTHALVRLFLNLEMGPIINPTRLSPYEASLPSLPFSELLSYASSQSWWIEQLMDRLASVHTPQDTLRVSSRRMIPPEALLTLFTTLPKTFRPALSQKNPSPSASDSSIKNKCDSVQRKSDANSSHHRSIVCSFPYLSDIVNILPPLPPEEAFTSAEPSTVPASSVVSQSFADQSSQLSPDLSPSLSAPSAKFKGILSQVTKFFTRSTDSEEEDSCPDSPISVQEHPADPQPADLSQEGVGTNGHYARVQIQKSCAYYILSLCCRRVLFFCPLCQRIRIEGSRKFVVSH